MIGFNQGCKSTSECDVSSDVSMKRKLYKFEHTDVKNRWV